MCTSQVIQRDDFTSFNMVDVVIILVMGGCFILFDLTLHPLVHFIRTMRHSTNRFRRDDDWRYGSAYRSQAIAYRALGLGSWTTDRPIPTTTSPQMFKPLWTIEPEPEVGTTQENFETQCTSEPSSPLELLSAAGTLISDDTSDIAKHDEKADVHFAEERASSIEER